MRPGRPARSHALAHAPFSVLIRRPFRWKTYGQMVPAVDVKRAKIIDNVREKQLDRAPGGGKMLTGLAQRTARRLDVFMVDLQRFRK